MAGQTAEFRDTVAPVAQGTQLQCATDIYVARLQARCNGRRSILQAAQGEAVEPAAPVSAVTPAAEPSAEEEEAAMADIMMTRKKRKLYNSVVKAKSAKRARAETLKARAAAAGANAQT